MTFLLVASTVNAQQAKDGNYTVTGNPEVMNAYTSLSSNASSGATSIQVANNALNAGDYFSTNLAPGDLIFIIQMQGVSLLGGQFWTGSYFIGDTFWYTLGQVTNYNNCGNHEFAEVASVSGSNTITLRCGLQFDYTSNANVQVIRVPRFDNLVVNGGASIAPPAWNGVTGGAVVLEVSGDLTLNGTIDASGLGFRPGIAFNNNSNNGAGQSSASNGVEGAEKGEGIAGYQGDYLPYGGRYCKGAFANAGGGSTGHNGGGGGGSNASQNAWDMGNGVPAPGYNAAWDLETGVSVTAGHLSSMTSGTVSGGGGRGGYTYSGNNANALMTGPNNAAWGDDGRRIQGGQGGRPLDYSTGKIFIGGGGAGDGNNGDAGSGGHGGGLIYIASYGDITGGGLIAVDGEDGENSDVSNPPFGGHSGNDGAGGAGAGGTVVVNSTGSITGISVTADGGDGGNSDMVAGAFGSISKAYGPGGGGGGGYISTSSAVTTSVLGGANGTTNSPDLTEFPPNGATLGDAGITNTNQTAYGFTVADDTVCGGGSATLTITTFGTVPGGTTVVWYSDAGSTIVGTGNSFTTPVLVSNTTYYVGMCPGSNLQEVNVVVSPGITIDDSGINVSDENCGNVDGSIVGITASGGTGTLVYDWNGNGTIGADTLNLAAGSYTLTVTDDNGCTASSGPYTVNNSGGPSIDDSGIIISNENCGDGSGSITGIVVTGGTGTLNYDWNGNTTIGADTLNLNAGSYTLTVSDGLGCVATSGPYVVNNNGAPTVDVSGMIITDETCTASNGSIVGITVSGGTSPVFDWNGNVVGTPDISGLPAGSYTFTVTDGPCSVSVGPFTISDNPDPVIDISAISIADENCGQVDGSITGISATGSPTLSYDWGSGASATPDISGLSAGNYTLTVTDGNGCTATSGPHAVGAYAGPSIDISNMVITDESCFGNDGGITGIVVTGAATITFDWNGSSTPTADLSGVTNGSYTLTVTDGVGCTATSGPHAITQIPAPSIDDSGISIVDEACGNSDGSITGITVSGGSGTLSYDWNGNSSTGPDLSGANANTYTLTVTDAAGCTATSGPYTINGTPPVTVVASGPSTICEGQSASFTGSGAVTYEWIPGGTGSTISLSPTTTTSYQLVGTDGPCTDTAQFTITVNPLPVAGITGDTVICEGESTTLTAAGSFNFEWSDASTGTSISVSPLTTSTYYLIASNTCGDDTSYVNVVVNALPNADAGPDQSIFAGGSAQLDGAGGTSYLWSPSDGLSCTSCEDPLASPLTSTTYIVTVTDSNGCVRSDTVQVIVDESALLFIPNVFSPNGDGMNDILYVRGGGIEQFQFVIYDRWGEKVFETDDLDVGWDGMYKGAEAVQGVYVYGISGRYYSGDEINQNGNITLVR